MTDVLGSHECLEITSPVHGDLVGWLPMARPDEAASSVHRAQQAAGQWRRTAPAARAERLHASVGTVKINAVFGGAPGGAAQPRGASGSGFGYGPELLDEFTTTKVVHIGLPETGPGC